MFCLDRTYCCALKLMRDGFDQMIRPKRTLHVQVGFVPVLPLRGVRAVIPPLQNDMGLRSARTSSDIAPVYEHGTQCETNCPGNDS